MMNHWDRVHAAIRGEATDCLPISLWRHWPELDQEPRALAKAVVSWQRRFDFDLVLFMPANTYAVEDWGAQTAYRPNPMGVRTVTKPIVTDAGQWPRLARLAVDAGCLAMQNAALGMAVQALGDTVPVLQTVYSPLTTARGLAGDLALEHMRAHPEMLEAGLNVIAETTAEFARAAIRAGASGLALVTDCASFDVTTQDEYLRFGRAFDLRVLEAVRGRVQYNLLRINGRNIMFDVAADYPVAMINWEDRQADPDLRAAKSRFKGLLVGGIDESGALLGGPESVVREALGEAMAQTGRARLMLAPGYACALETPEAHIAAAVSAARAPVEPAEKGSR